MKFPIIEFTYSIGDKLGTTRKMLVSLDDIEHIDEKYLCMKADSYEYDLVAGEYERIKKGLEAIQ